MPTAKDIKPGMLVVTQGAPCLIKEVFAQSPSARGAQMIYKYRAVNLLTKQKVDLTLRGGDSLPEADFERRAAKLMFTDATHAHWLDQQDYNTHSLPLEAVREEVPYLTTETEGVFVLLYNGEPVGVQPPVAVVLRITQCDPAVRGNSATARTKPLTLETGLVVHGPEYLAEGELAKVDTRTGEFLGRG